MSEYHPYPSSISLLLLPLLTKPKKRLRQNTMAHFLKLRVIRSQIISGLASLCCKAGKERLKVYLGPFYAKSWNQNIRPIYPFNENILGTAKVLSLVSKFFCFDVFTHVAMLYIENPPLIPSRRRKGLDKIAASVYNKIYFRSIFLLG